MESLAPSLASFLPTSLVRRLARTGELIEGPWEARAEGALLMTDVVGFSRLAEALNRQGELGAEELAARLNACLAPIVSTILAHGGHLIDFAGDAVIASWPAEEHDSKLSAAARRAVACAKALPPAVAVSGGGAPLKVRVGVSTGELIETVVGGVDGAWRYLVRGAAFDAISSVLAAAKNGEALMSEPCARLLGFDAKTNRIRELELDDRHRETPPPSSSPEETLEARLANPYLPITLRGVGSESASSGINAKTSLRWLAENRNVSVLFASLAELSSPSATLEQFQRATAVIQRLLEESGGAIQQLITDDKGTVLIAAWGVRNATHPDDPGRAVQTALRLRRELMQVGVGSRIGVTTGRVCCALRGTPSRREYALLGSVINLAARLMGQAESVLCDGRTANAAAQRVDFIERPPIKVKGWEEAISVFLPTGLRHRSEHSVAVHGRERELQAFSSALDGPARETGAVIVMRGEAGIGKSTLLSACETHARQRGWLWLEGWGDILGRTSPYQGWRNILSTALGVAAVSDASTFLAALDSAGVSLDLAPLLSPLLPVDLPPSPTSLALNGPARIETTAKLVIAVLNTLSERHGLVLTIDDAQWLDSASWLLLRRLTESLPPLLVLISSRPAEDDSPSELDHILEWGNAELLEIGPLSTDGTQALVCEQLGARDIEPELLKQLSRQSDGNPLHAAELARALADAGKIGVSEGMVRLVSGSLQSVFENIPGGMEAVVASRLDRMTGPVQVTTKAASVIGLSFDLSLLTEVHPWQAGEELVREHLDELCTANLVNEQTLEPGDAHAGIVGPAGWRFRHRVIQETAYRMLLREQRRELHRTIAESLGRQFGDDPAVSSLLAEHWVRAEVRDEAIAALERAGDHAFEAYANAEAHGFFERALELAGTGPDAPARERRGKWERRAADARLQLGLLDTARQGATRALADLGMPLPRTSFGRGWAMFRAALVQLAHRLVGPAELPEAARDSVREAVLSYSVVATVGFWRNDPWAVAYGSVAAANLCDRLPPSGLRARASAGMCLVCGAIPIHGAAESYGLRAVQMAREVDDANALAYSNLFLGLYYHGAGRLDEALEAARAARLGYAQLGSSRRMEEAMSLELSVHQARGSIGEIRELASAMADSARERGDRQTVQLAVGMQGLVAEWNDDIAGAIDMWSTVGLDSDDRLVRIAYMGGLARGHLLLGDEEQARELATALIDEVGTARGLGVNAFDSVLRATVTVAALWHRARQRNDATEAELSKRARAGLRAVRNMARVFPLAVPAVDIAKAAIELARGRGQAAKELLDQAHRGAQELGAKVLSWHASQLEPLFNPPPERVLPARAESP